MKCPHCLESFFPEYNDQYIEWPDKQYWLKDEDGHWSIKTTKCPACGRATMVLRQMSPDNAQIERKRYQVWPKGTARQPLPAEIPEQFASDYRESCNVLSDSPKASAALSRRCLQNLLRDKAGVKSGDLSKEIDEVLSSKALPSDLADAIDAIRNIGNFAAHPLKSTNTGSILDVEPGEAEWNLDVLEDLFDFYFVRPAKLAAKVATLNQKLAEAGKPPMKKGKT